MNRRLVLAAAAGVPALVYEIVWTREVALLVGGQIEAISVVLATFFGGLAIGARWIGPRADTRSDLLRLYARLEGSAGLLALASSFLLRALAGDPLGGGALLTLILCCVLLLPVTVLLGGTLPILLRSATSDPEASGRIAGWLVGANTLGAVTGVAVATLCIPRLGLRATLIGAALVACAIAAVANHWAGTESEPATEGRSPGGSPPPVAVPPIDVLVAAALVGAATLGYEVLAARGAMLRLGSSLYAWALVLGLFLAGLALGNLAGARWANRSRSPATALGIAEAGAAFSVAAGLTLLIPAITVPASGLRTLPVLAVVIAILPAAVFMGAAFPLLVRLARPVEGALASSFARVSAANTAGGIAGTLLAPLVLLPSLGFTNAVLLCAVVNALVAGAYLARGAPIFGPGGLRAAATLAIFATFAALVQDARPPARSSRVLSVEHGRQATAVVLHEGTHRTLVVDGDAEAATGGDARITEEMLAALPLLLHPAPRRLLEVGLGSGISLGTAARFPLREIDCVEIAGSVLRSARFFAPDNGDITSGRDGRVTITQADGRAFLAHRAGRYDIIVANTLHPWSVGATGLYSREYFERIARALTPGGIAVQWVALDPIGEETLAAILRTMADVFPYGSVWWAADNLLVVGRNQPGGDEVSRLRSRSGDPEVATALRGLQLADADAFAERRIGSFEAVRSVLGAGPVLRDDRPVLEVLASQRAALRAVAAMGLVVRIAEAGAREDPRSAPLLLWLESERARVGGQPTIADGRVELAEAAGLRLARDSRLARTVRTAEADLEAGRRIAAEAGFRSVLRSSRVDRGASFALANLAYEAGELGRSIELLERMLASHPDDASAWNLLAAVRESSGDLEGARRALEEALRADPFMPRALANAGLISVDLGDLRRANEMLRRLDAVSPLGETPEGRALRSAISDERSLP